MSFIKVLPLLAILFIVIYSINISQSFTYGQSGEFTFEKDDLLYATTNLTEKDLKECEDIHVDYKLDESAFIRRYIYHNFVGSCVMLFDDPLWDYQGGDRYDRLSERASELADERKPRPVLMKIEPRLIVASRIPQTYLISFTACTLEQPVKASAIIVSSDIKSVSTISFSESDFVMPPNSCNLHEVNISASAPDKIRLLIPGADVVLSGKFKAPSQSETLKATREGIPAKINKNEIAVGKLSNLLHVDRPLTESELKQCRAFYQDYASLDGDSFALRYRYQKFAGDCVLLYNDPIWDNKDKTNLDSINQRLEGLRHPTKSIATGLALPEWVKDNMKQWSEGKTDNSGFASGIQFMIGQKLISVPDLSESTADAGKEKIPDWIKNNIGWWLEGQIAEDDFINGIEHLVKRGVIMV